MQETEQFDSHARRSKESHWAGFLLTLIVSQLVKDVAVFYETLEVHYHVCKFSTVICS